MPNVISKERSHERETFSTELYGKGEYPQFTRPEMWRKQKVPDVLLSGNAENIQKYQFENLKNCTVLEKNSILFREKYNQKLENKTRIKLEKFSSNKNIRKKYAKLLEYKESDDLYILECDIFQKTENTFEWIKNVKINIKNLNIPVGIDIDVFNNFEAVCISNIVRKI